MGMSRSPHRKRRPGKLHGDVTLPFGKKAGLSHKPSGGANPSNRVFKDPQGHVHVTPVKAKRTHRAAG